MTKLSDITFEELVVLVKKLAYEEEIPALEHMTMHYHPLITKAYMQAFCDATQTKSEIPYELSQYFSKIFQEVLNGEKLDHAFSFKRNRKRGRPTNAFKREKQNIFYILPFLEDQHDQGKTFTEAIEAALQSDDLNFCETRIKEAYSKRNKSRFTRWSKK